MSRVGIEEPKNRQGVLLRLHHSPEMAMVTAAAAVVEVELVAMQVELLPVRMSFTDDVKGLLQSGFLCCSVRYALHILIGRLLQHSMTEGVVWLLAANA
mmetsp:Transcript_29153/g.57074  ORF Transcript_29153/g.57074 Transcript_29153/m.57074 type:complete len:99 (-) Transcript_29153:4-300(-)